MTKAKNVEEYIARQRVAIAGNPDCGVSRYNLAVALLGLQKYDEAEKELIATIHCSPNLAEAPKVGLPLRISTATSKTLP